MLPKPQCPYCGVTFDSLAAALTHLDTHLGRPLAQAESLLPDSAMPLLTSPEADDPTAQQIEEAG
jgi:hypothetical protein